jgi:hypothetical protein
MFGFVGVKLKNRSGYLGGIIQIVVHEIAMLIPKQRYWKSVYAIRKNEKGFNQTTKALFYKHEII